MRHTLPLTFAAALFASSAAAAAPMDLSIIDRAVTDFTGADIGQPGGAKLPVDRRLRLTACQAPLDLQWFGRDQRSVLLYAGGAPGYRDKCDEVAAAGYAGMVLR